MGLSNEVLCMLVAQGAAKLPEIKVGDTEKNPGLKPGLTQVVQIGPSC